jgi:hypothetical protein
MQRLPLLPSQRMDHCVEVSESSDEAVNPTVMNGRFTTSFVTLCQSKNWSTMYQEMKAAVEEREQPSMRRY